VNLSDAAVTQVMIPVDDLEGAIAFYRDTLGIPLLFTAPPMMAFFKSGAIRLLVGVLPAGEKAQAARRSISRSPTFRTFIRRSWPRASSSAPPRTS